MEQIGPATESTEAALALLELKERLENIEKIHFLLHQLKVKNSLYSV